MRSSFAGLEMSKRTIQLSQKSLDIATNNMANISTPGYSRQRVDVHSMYLNSYKNWQTRLSRLSLAGQGSGAHGVAQIRDFYLDKRFREMNSHMAGLERKMPILEEIQTTIDNFENVGMEAKLAQFKDALSKYGTNSPDSRELASLVRNSARDIAVMLNTYARDYDKMLEDNVVELGTTVDYVNTLFEKVASLNKAIVKEYKATEYGAIFAGKGVSPYGPLELMDERNLVIDELSTFANIKIEENVDGSINVLFGEVMMVRGEKYEALVMYDYDQFNAAVIYASNGQSPNFRSGEIRAYMDLVNGNGPYANYYQSSDYGIPYYRSAVDAFAEAFANLFNTTNGTTNENPLRAMFGSTLDRYDENGDLIERGPITASTIRISDEWMHDATMIGLVYDEVIGSRITNYSFPSDLSGLTPPIAFGVTVNGTASTISFNGTAADLQAQLDLVFPGALTVDTDGGNITITAVNEADTYSVTPGFSVSANAADGTFSIPNNFSFGDYSLVVNVGGVEQTINFDGSQASLQAALDAAFGTPNGVVVTIDGDNMVLTSEDPNDTLNVTSPASVGITTNRENITSGGWAYSTTLDGNNIKKLLLALDQPVKFGRALDFEGTAFDYVAFISNRLGQGISFIEEQLDTMVVTTNNLLDSRDAIMGVSNDEEGINMLIYQKWYNAAARMMTALDECLDRIINGMGRVGL